MSSERDERQVDRAALPGGMAGSEADCAVAVAFQRDLYLYWRWLTESHGVALTNRGYITRPALRRLRAALTVPSGQHVTHAAESGDSLNEAEDLRLLFIRRLAQRLGLLTSDEGKLIASDRQMMARYLQHPLAERLRICVRVWSAGGWWPDAPDAKVPPPRVMAPAPPRLALARRRLLESLKRLPAGVPQPLPVLDGVIAARHGATGASRSRRAPRAPSIPADPEATTRYAALTGPLAWLGLVELREHMPGLGVTDYTPLPTLSALARPESAAEYGETPGRVVVQSNFEVVAYPPLTAPALLTLDTCAECVSLDVTARYQLTRASLARAHADGRTADAVATRLEALSSAPLPPNVRVTLADWERHVERVSLLDGVTLLEVRDAALLDALVADRAAAGWVERRLTPTAAILAEGRADACRAWLLRRGEVPAMISPAETP